MNDPQRYDRLVQSLLTHGYTVTLGEHGYRVSSQADPSDVSHARHLDDLADLAELMRWRAQYDIRRQQAK